MRKDLFTTEPIGWIALAIAFLFLVMAEQLFGQETNEVARPEPGAVYLWVRNSSAAANALAKLDDALGYPNPATLTERAIEYQMLSNGTNALVRIDLGGIYSPKSGKYHDLAQSLQNQVTAAQWGTDVCTNASQLTGRSVARVSGSLARQIGSFLAKAQSNP